MEQVKIRRNLFVDYFFLVFVILWSGGLVTYGLINNWQYVMFFLISIVFFNRKLAVESINLATIGVFAIVALLHSVVFSGPFTSIFAPVLGLVDVAMIAVILRPRFNYLFIKISFFFAVISLCFWVIDIIPSGHDFLWNTAKQLPQLGRDILESSKENDSGIQQYTLYFYSVRTGYEVGDFYSVARNSGPFYEPGRFTILLTITLALILFNDSFKKYKKEFFCILVADITTFSTTGYIVFILMLVSYFIGRGRKLSLGSVVLLLLLYVVAYYVLQTSFMGEKIVKALDQADIANTRFGAMYYHWTQIIQSPWIGYGVFLEKRFTLLELSPCGITDMMRIWGIPLFGICVLLLFRGTKAIMVNNIMYKLSFVLVLLLLAYTQTIMNQPLYCLFYFIGSEKYLYESKK